MKLIALLRERKEVMQHLATARARADVGNVVGRRKLLTETRLITSRLRTIKRELDSVQVQRDELVRLALAELDELLRTSQTRRARRLLSMVVELPKPLLEYDESYLFKLKSDLEEYEAHVATKEIRQTTTFVRMMRQFLNTTANRTGYVGFKFTVGGTALTVSKWGVGSWRIDSRFSNYRIVRWQGVEDG